MSHFMVLGTLEGIRRGGHAVRWWGIRWEARSDVLVSLGKASHVYLASVIALKQQRTGVPWPI